MPAAPHIILVHGLGRTRFDMSLMAHRLRHHLPESSIHTFGYPSRSLTLERAAAQLGHFVDSITTSEPVSFVGHSLGGIVVRALDLSGRSRVPLHRLVTLGSPHNGATIARFLARYRLPRGLFGPVLADLGALSLPNSTRQLEIGCIVGATSTRFGFLPVFGADNDGLVLTREASFSGCRDQVSTLSFHGIMPFSGRLSRLSARFLAEGRFR